MTNLVSIAFTNKLLISAAYKFAALAVMLTNCNLFIQETHLPTNHPIMENDIILSRCSVNPPRLLGFGGSVVTEKYFFGFGHDHLANFWQWEFHGTLSAEEMRMQHERWSTMTSLVETNEARQLALSWLTAIGVNTVLLEEKYPCKIKQRFFYRNGSEKLGIRSKVMLPIYEVAWGSVSFGRPEYKLAAVSMTVFGPTKELIEYHLIDNALMLRSKLGVKNPEALLAIPDSEFLQFDDLQRRSLVRQLLP